METSNSTLFDVLLWIRKRLLGLSTPGGVALAAAALLLLIKRISKRRQLRKLAADESTFVGQRSDMPNVESLPSTVVRTSKGRIRGFVAPVPNDLHRKDKSKSHVINFRGIPYAAPPVGENRFKHPKDVEPWSSDRNMNSRSEEGSILDCRRFGPWSIANPYYGVEVVLISKLELFAAYVFRCLTGWGGNIDPKDPQPLPPTMSEKNCLTLNVCTPYHAIDHEENSNAYGETIQTGEKETAAQKLPVAVWFHGGGFEMGSSSEELYTLHWGHPLALRDVIFVSANYRLGVLGYGKFHGGDANNGLADQVKVLEWVQKEIHHFGGDPNNVTVFGESAGAMSVAAMMSSSRISKLFNRAILQSGAGYNVISESQARMVSKEISKALGVGHKSTDGVATIDELSQFSGDAIFAAQNKVDKATKSPMLIQLHVDGDLIPTLPTEAVYDGASRHIDLMVGTTRDEAHLFRHAMPLGLGPFNLYTVKKFLAPFFGPMMLNVSSTVEEAEKIVESFAVLYHDYYLNGKDSHDPHGASNWIDVFYTMLTHIIFEAPATLVAEAHSASKSPGKKTYKYRFDYRLGPRRAAHGIELPFMHGTWRWHSKSWQLKRLLGEAHVLPLVRELSETMLDAWAGFIANGDPNTKHAKESMGLVWPEFTRKRRAMLLFDVRKRRVYQTSRDDAEHRDENPGFHMLVEHRLSSSRGFGFIMADFEDGMSTGAESNKGKGTKDTKRGKRRHDVDNGSFAANGDTSMQESNYREGDEEEEEEGEEELESHLNSSLSHIDRP